MPENQSETRNNGQSPKNNSRLENIFKGFQPLPADTIFPVVSPVVSNSSDPIDDLAPPVAAALFIASDSFPDIESTVLETSDPDQAIPVIASKSGDITPATEEDVSEGLAIIEPVILAQSIHAETTSITDRGLGGAMAPAISATLVMAPVALNSNIPSAAVLPNASPLSVPGLKPGTRSNQGKRRESQKGWGDIILILVVGILMLGAIYLQDWLPIIRPLRIVLGFAYLLVTPGFCLTAAIFPRQDDLDGLERAGLSLGLSVTLIPIQALVLDWLPYGLNFYSILAISLAFSAVFILIAALQRWRLPAELAYAPGLRLSPAARWQGLSTGDRSSYLIAVLILLLTSAAAVYAISSAAAEQRTTEFFILGKNGLAQEYPRSVALGQSQSLSIGINNQEDVRQAFWVEARSEGTLIGLAGPFVLNPDESLQAPIEFTLVQSGKDISIDFLLYNADVLNQKDDQGPYRSLKLWLEVTPVSADWQTVSQ